MTFIIVQTKKNCFKNQGTKKTAKNYRNFLQGQNDHFLFQRSIKTLDIRRSRSIMPEVRRMGQELHSLLR